MLLFQKKRKFFKYDVVINDRYYREIINKKSMLILSVNNLMSRHDIKLNNKHDFKFIFR